MQSFALALLLVLSASSSAMATTLEQSVQRELTLLRQERRTLLKLKVEAEATSKKQSAAARAKLENLTASLLELREKNQTLSEKNQSPLGAPIAQQGQLLERSLNRLNKALQNLPAPIPAITTDFERTPKALEAVLNQIFLEGSLHIEKNGSYFGENGSARKSDILWISKLSAIALNSEGGPLLPTESNNLHLAPHLKQDIRVQAVSDGNTLAQSQTPKLVGALLFDPDFPINNQFQSTRGLIDAIEDGGLVMWPILLLAFLGVFICLERIWNLQRVHTNAAKLMTRVDQFIQQGMWAQADQCCEKNPGVVAKVMRVILQHRQLTRDQMEDRANEVILTSRPELERFLSGLNVIAAVSPLLGLLGTVTGMIATFLVITQHGTGDPKLMAGGISEALLTTQYGLIVAIPALMAHSLLSRWVEHILGDIETNSLQLLNSIEHLSIAPKTSKVHELNPKVADNTDA